MAEEIEQPSFEEAGAADGPSPEMTRIIPVRSDMPNQIADAARQLLGDLVALSKRSDHILFLMGVNVDTAKAELVPIPTLDNMKRMNKQFNQLPNAVRTALKNCIPERDMAAAESIWTFLNNNPHLPEVEEEAASAEGSDID